MFNEVSSNSEGQKKQQTCSGWYKCVIFYLQVDYNFSMGIVLGGMYTCACVRFRISKTWKKSAHQRFNDVQNIIEV